MCDLSDAETESESSIDDWDTTDLAQMPLRPSRSGDGAVGTSEVLDALNTLRKVDICAVEQDERSHKTIQHIYERLLGFLELVSAAQYESPVDAIGIRPALSAILSESTLILLLEFRVLFRNIASRHVAASSAGVTICWVDVVLARLGQSIFCVAGMFGDVKSEDANQPKALRAQKEDDMLRAAIQLPGKWQDVVGVIGSKYASPAAARLASTLAWGVYVMTEKLSENRSVMTQEIKAYLTEALQRRLKQVGLKRTQRVDAHMVAESERFTDAIVVSLYAMSELNADNPESPCRPQLHATLIDMIHTIMQFEDESPDSVLSQVVSKFSLNLPQIILLKWGQTLPWSWRTWSDRRTYHSDVILPLTAGWLFHLENPLAEVSSAHSTEWWDDELLDALHVSPSIALSTMSRLLQSLTSMSQRDGTQSFSTAAMDVVLKACWSVKHILSSGATQSDPSLVQLYVSLYGLFILLGDAVEELCVKDLILENLSLRPTTLELALNNLTDRSEYSVEWQRKLNVAYTLVSGCRQRATATMSAMRSLRQTLQFLTLACRAGKCCPLPVLASRLLVVMLDWIESENLGSATWNMLADATISALTEWRLCVTAESPAFRASSAAGAARVWCLAARPDPCNLTLSASIAAYISTTARQSPCDALQYSECWNYLRDTTLMILDREFQGIEEPLALLVAPMICRALATLVQFAPVGAKRYITMSPWTHGLRARLQRLARDNTSPERDQYQAMLWEFIRSPAESFMRELDTMSVADVRIVGTSTDNEPESLPALSYTFCWLDSRACLVPA